MKRQNKTATTESRRIAMTCAKVCDEKKGEDVAILDVHKLTFITDFFVLCTARNERQSKAIADEIEIVLKEKGIRKLGSDGFSSANWVLRDFGDVVVHIFTPELRQFYSIEMLWGDAKSVRWQFKTNRNGRKTTVKKSK